jgi:hypothetical protein
MFCFKDPLKCSQPPLPMHILLKWINCLGVDPMSSVWWLQLEPALLSASVCTLAPACLQLSPHCFSIMFWTLRITRPLITGAHR